MKKIIFRYGMYATLVIVGLGMFGFFVINKMMGYSLQEIYGYLTMLLSMIFVFLGIRHYRDEVNNGRLTFGQGLKIGVLIVLIPSVFFGLFDMLYTQVINPGWANEYYTQYLQKIKASTPPDKLDAVLKKVAAEKEFFNNPVMLFLVMTFTVFIIGFIVTIISSLALRRSSTAAAA